MIRILTLLTVFFVLILSRAESKDAWTLEDVYRQALTQDESLIISQEKINELRGKFLQILGGSLPQIGHRDLLLLQESTSVNDGNSNTFTKQTRPQSGFYASIPLFKGFQEYHVTKLKKESFKQARYNIKQEELNLYADVARLMIAWTQTSQDLRLINNLVLATRERVRETKNDIQLGKTLSSQGLAEEAELSLLLAEQEQLKGNHATILESIKLVTGKSLLPNLSPVKFDLKKMPSKRDILDRPDILATLAQTEIANRELKVSQAKLLPRIDAEANYYHYRTGFQKDISWDSTVELNLPLINADYWGEIKQAKSKKLQALLIEKQNVEAAQNELIQAGIKLDSFKKQDIKLLSAQQLAKKRFEASQNDFKSGLVGPLDVLEAQRDYLKITRDRHRVAALLQESYVNYWLQMGQIP